MKQLGTQASVSDALGSLNVWLKDTHISKELRIITAFAVSNKPAKVISQCKISSISLFASTKVTSKFFYSTKIKIIIQVIYIIQAIINTIVVSNRVGMIWVLYTDLSCIHIYVFFERN